MCVVEDCKKVVFIKKRGLCSAHYQRWFKYGDPLFIPSKPELKIMPLMKICSRCGKNKERTKFRAKPEKSPQSVSSCCKVCENWRTNERVKRKPETKRRLNKEARDRRHGWSSERFNALMYAQNGLCFICEGSLWGVTHKDHDHGKEVPRGLLCGLCNPGIGFFKDDIGALENAIRYLKLFS